MKILVVHAHPERQSFNTAMYGRIVETLRSAGHEIRVSDLYEKNFNPVASGRDFGDRADGTYLTYALEQRHGVKNGTIAPDIQAELEDVLWCDMLILNFPVLWFSMPAILKGWIDRVFVSGAVYGGMAFYDRGRLAGRRAMVTVSIGGREHMFGDGSLHGPIEDMLRPILRGTLYYVGLEVLEPFVAYHVPYISQEARTAILDDLERQILHLDDRRGLAFPSLDDFDEHLYPLKPGVAAE